MNFIKVGLVILLLVTLLAIVAACKQERLIFFPEKLPADYKFSFNNRFNEYFIEVDKKTKIHGLLFKADSTKGLVFYLHGNAGSNSSWGGIADVYLENNYDFFVLDYRGFGKSEGKISGEKQFFSDIQIAYDSLKTTYLEKEIVIIGYSIGTGPATFLASKNNPKLLILKAPYYNIPDLVKKHFKIFPEFLIRYKFRTDQYIREVKCQVMIFHGEYDEIIDVSSSYRLQKLFKQQDSLVILKNQGHNGINSNGVYLLKLNQLLKH